MGSPPPICRARLTPLLSIVSLTFMLWGSASACAWGQINLNSGLVLHYTFDEGTGQTMSDASPSGYHARCGSSSGADSSDPTWVTGKIGGAMQFDGNNDYIRTTNNFVPPATATISFWMRGAGNPSSTVRLFGTTTGWEIRQETSGRLIFQLYYNGGLTSFSTTSPVSTPGQWYHVIAVRLSNGGYGVAVNGTLHTMGTLVYHGQSSNPLSVGTRTGSSNYWRGTLDDLRIYNRQLSEPEILALYRLGAEGLVGHWKLDETTGSLAADASSQANHGTVNAGIRTEGVYGRGLQFTGSGYVNVPHDTSLQTQNSVTVAAWIYLDDATGNQNVVQKGSNYALWEIRSGGTPYNTMQINGSWRMFPYSVTAGEFVGRWRHVAFTYDGNQVVTYLDGAIDSVVPQTGYMTTDTRWLGIGTNGDWGDARFRGKIDDVRVYKSVLTPGEISELYGLLIHWKLDETWGTTAYDSTGNSRHGTLASSPAWGTGKRDGGLHFDGIDDFVYLIDAGPVLNGLSAISVSLWIKAYQADVDQGIFYTQIPNGSDTELGLRYARSGKSGAEQVVVASLRTTAGTTAIDSSPRVQRAGWQNLILTWKAGEALQLYINGQPSTPSYNQGPRGGTIVGADHLGLGIGSQMKFWRGALDDFRIYNRVLTPEEIEEHSRGGTQGLRILKWGEVR